MLKIRLQRIGRKKRPSYRVIVSEHTKDTQAGSLEILGHYDPLAEPKIMEFKGDRILHWISVGAQPSATVQNLLINAGIIKGEKGKAVTITKKRAAKIAEKAENEKAKAEEAKKAQEEAAAEAATPEVEEEKPAEEPVKEEEASKEEQSAPEVEETAAPAEDQPEAEKEEEPTPAAEEKKEEATEEAAPKESEESKE